MTAQWGWFHGCPLLTVGPALSWPTGLLPGLPQQVGHAVREAAGEQMAGGQSGQQRGCRQRPRFSSPLGTQRHWVPWPSLTRTLSLDGRTGSSRWWAEPP